MLRRQFATIAIFAGTAFAQQTTTPSAINFNLVQVNHYDGQEQVTGQVTTPGQRVVIDPNNPSAKMTLRGAVNVPPQAARVPIAFHTSISSESCPTVLPWESSAIVTSPSGQDSFLVTASRTGCPGTEVKPSVSVAFRTSRGWSDPPIRFGPLTYNTICALGRGQQLEVSVVGAAPPTVKLCSAK